MFPNGIQLRLRPNSARGSRPKFVFAALQGLTSIIFARLPHSHVRCCLDAAQMLLDQAGMLQASGDLTRQEPSDLITSYLFPIGAKMRGICHVSAGQLWHGTMASTGLYSVNRCHSYTSPHLLPNSHHHHASLAQ